MPFFLEQKSLYQVKLYLGHSGLEHKLGHLCGGGVGGLDVHHTRRRGTALTPELDQQTILVERYDRR